MSGLSAVPVKTALNAGGDAPIFACRAFVLFDGGGVVNVKASGNVAQITDLGTSQYRIGFAVPMPDANFVHSHSYSDEVTDARHTQGWFVEQTADYLTIKHHSERSSAALVDKKHVAVAVFR